MKSFPVQYTSHYLIQILLKKIFDLLIHAHLRCISTNHAHNKPTNNDLNYHHTINDPSNLDHTLSKVPIY